MIYVVMICIFLILGLGLGYFFCYQSKGLMRLQHLLQVKQAYARKSQAPKRFIVGASDVLYSFDTDKIEAATGCRTVNFGLNVGLGLGFILDKVTEVLQPGDDVILCLAYASYFKPSYSIFAYEYYRMYEKRLLKRFTLKEHLIYLLGNFKLNMEYQQKQFDLSDSGAYVHVKGALLPEKKNKPLVFPAQFTKGSAVASLEAFVKTCEANQIRVRVTYSSMLGFAEYEDNAYLEQLVAYLEKNYEVIGQPANYLVPWSEIFNSVYHVNEIGQERRTKLFLKEISQDESDG